LPLNINVSIQNLVRQTRISVFNFVSVAGIMTIKIFTNTCTHVVQSHKDDDRTILETVSVCVQGGPLMVEKNSAGNGV
ncbi:MAG: hypothetical protein AB2693_33540, partial [Candidatus Thiodiazotropha sp.]